jgi:hypothetical protein
MQKTLLDTNVSNTTVVKSPWVGIGDLINLGLQLATTGTLAGNWAIQTTSVDGADVLSDPESALGADVTAAFVNAGGSPVLQPAGSPMSQHTQCPPNLSSGYLRVIFTPGSGSGRILASLSLHSPRR